LTLESGFHGVLDSQAQPTLQDIYRAGLPTPLRGSGPFLGGAWHAQRQEAFWHGSEAVSIACHGEIFNSSALCKTLGLAPHTPLPQVLLAGWQCWSFRLIERLDGQFAFVARDGHDVFLYRDPSGLRNLYLHTADNARLAFATDLDTLLRLPGVERRLARRSLHEYLRFLDVAAPNTWFENVQAVEAGRLMRWSGRKIEKQASPASDAPARPPPARLDDAVAELDEMLRLSVENRLADCSRPAAFLSGGIDSSLICAMAARGRRDLGAITVGFDSPLHDEAPVARRIAAHLGLAHQVLRFSRSDYLSAFERLGQSMDQPMADPATPATLLAFEYCRDRFDAVLDGTGADESVGTMPPRHLRVAVEYGNLLPRAMRRSLIRAMRPLPLLSGYTPILDFEHVADTMIRWKGFSREEIEALCGEPVSFEHTHFYRTFARFDRSAHFERGSALLNAAPSDRMNQATQMTGARIRYPFCDAATDRFLRQLPIGFRYLPAQPKRILRELLARYVPREIWDMPKHGFDFPLHAFLAGDNFCLVRRHLNPEFWRQSGILDAEMVQHYAAGFMAGDERLTFRVWALVMLGSWLQQHDELR
jgi:asparagine synthase (glutamine-hydrolysing)